MTNEEGGNGACRVPRATALPLATLLGLRLKEAPVVAAVDAARSDSARLIFFSWSWWCHSLWLVVGATLRYVWRETVGVAW